MRHTNKHLTLMHLLRLAVITTKAALQRDAEDNRHATGRNIYVTYESA